MVSHLRTCLPQHAGAAPSEVLLIRAQAVYPRAYWLDCASPMDATLQHLDTFLRRTWLECCGHMSAFTDSRRGQHSMKTPLATALHLAGGPLGYEYDFGSTTSLVLTLSGIVTTSATKSVRLIARNVAPVWPCDSCGRTSTVVCTECRNEGDGFCCADHVATHPCGDEMLLPVVNSPRMGVCGYAGAE